jgi:diguanylate cyclase (GGDEF)-like protein/PAS domain S-box-containing protein
MDQGLLMVAADGTIPVWNKRALELLELPLDIMEGQPRFADVLQFQFNRGDYDGTDHAVRAWFKSANIEQTQHTYERQTLDGRYLEIRSVPAPNGAMVRTYTDITDRKHAELALKAAEREYRSLFENSVVGIYRARLDGTKVRANAAFVRVCGFNSEEELLVAQSAGRNWYVQPERGVEFMRRLKERGRVDDFVSEVYRGLDRQRIWVSETAWLVLDETGRGCCYEGTVVDTTERKEAEARVLYLARHDPLTDLPNRRLLLEHLTERLVGPGAVGKAVSVLCLDLDRFKSINDSLGHLVGDELLRVTAARIVREIGPEDMVGRFGGDEFVIAKTGGLEDAEHLARRLLDVIGEPMIVQGHRLAIGVSIGVACAKAATGDPDPLLRSADLALYRAKSAGRNTFRVYEPEMDAALEARRHMELDLRDALARGEFEVHYQPIMEAATAKVTNFEALVRWRHPVRGLVSPGEFIEVAEETGLIVSIGSWVLHQACRDAAKWRADISVSVNISPVQFRHGGVLEEVSDALAASGLRPGRLHLEITETALLDQSDTVASTLRELRSLGIRIALDDFGTGFSSLSYLRNLPLDKVKIDRSFTRDILTDPRTLAIVRAVLSMGTHLGFSTVAEGVETEEQFRLLLTEGCHEVQGYLLGRPAPVASLPELLASSEARMQTAA